MSASPARTIQDAIRRLRKLWRPLELLQINGDPAALRRIGEAVASVEEAVKELEARFAVTAATPRYLTNTERAASLLKALEAGLPDLLAGVPIDTLHDLVVDNAPVADREYWRRAVSAPLIAGVLRNDLTVRDGLRQRAIAFEEDEPTRRWTFRRLLPKVQTPARLEAPK